MSITNSKNLDAAEKVRITDIWEQYKENQLECEVIGYGAEKSVMKCQKYPVSQSNESNKPDESNEYAISRFSDCVTKADEKHLKRIQQTLQEAYTFISIYVTTDTSSKCGSTNNAMEKTLRIYTVVPFSAQQANLEQVKTTVIQNMEHGILDLDLNFVRGKNEEEKNKYDNYRVFNGIYVFPIDLSYQNMIFIKSPTELKKLKITYPQIYDLVVAINKNPDSSTNQLEKVVEDEHSQKLLFQFVSRLRSLFQRNSKPEQQPEQQPKPQAKPPPMFFKVRQPEPQAKPPPMFFKVRQPEQQPEPQPEPQAKSPPRFFKVRDDRDPLKNVTNIRK